MNYATIKKYDIANGRGVRVSLFVSGCRHHCPGCFNPETWAFNYGKPYTKEIQETILKSCEPDYIEGLSLLGGEPFEPENIQSVLELITEFKKRFPTKTIWCYTGYKYEELLDGKLITHATAKTVSEEEQHIIRSILMQIDVLVDGEFHIAEKDLKLPFRGSSNQRLIDIAASHSAGTVVPYKVS